MRRVMMINNETGSPAALGVLQPLDGPVEAAGDPDVPVVGGRGSEYVHVDLTDPNLLEPGRSPGGSAASRWCVGGSSHAGSAPRGDRWRPAG